MTASAFSLAMVKVAIICNNEMLLFTSKSWNYLLPRALYIILFNFNNLEETLSFATTESDKVAQSTIIRRLNKPGFQRKSKKWTDELLLFTCFSSLKIKGTPCTFITCWVIDQASSTGNKWSNSPGRFEISSVYYVWVCFSTNFND